MARLTNTTKNNGFFYRVVLDNDNISTNYIERCKNTVYDEHTANHMCLKCLEVVHWINWTSQNRAKDKCSCGEVNTLEIIGFDQSAKSS